MNIQYFIVEESEDNLRLDQFLSKKILISREKIKDLFSANIENNLFTVVDLKKLVTMDIINKLNHSINSINLLNFFEVQNLKENKILSNKQIKLSQKIRTGECFLIRSDIKPIVKNNEINLKKYNFPDWIIYEDNHILIINKVPGILTHSKFENHEEISVVDLVKDYLIIKGEYKGVVGDPKREFIVHRLDRETSGLMILAKTNESYIALIEMFKNKQINKRYLGIVCGTPNPTSHTIRQFIARNKMNRLAMQICIQKNLKYHTDAREAITHYFVKEVFPKCSLVEFVLDTGRTHQIRVHMNFINHPIIGDKIYGINKHSLITKSLDVSRHMLHSYFLCFHHPITHDKLEFTIELPEDMEAVLKNLNN